MKQFLTTILLFLAILLPTCLTAHDFEIDGIYYKITSDNKVAVTYQGTSFYQYSNEYSGDVTIPSTISYNGNTYSVTSIGNNAFFWCFNLTSVNIPNSISTIGESAFYSCTSLTTINIPNSVTNISNNAFLECEGLTNITVASDNPIYDSRDDCNAIIKTASNTLITGCQNTFIPNSVITIGKSAFQHCKGLANINIPNSVTTIGEYAFSNCTGLVSVNMPNSVITIGGHAFEDCSKLTNITIPNSVISIGNSAFNDCSNLTSMTIPNSVSTIGDLAFRCCFRLTIINIPNSVTTIGYGAFSGCSQLTSIIVASDNPNYDSRNDCNAIIETASNTLVNGCKNTIIPNSVTTIGKSAFYYCNELTCVNIPNSVTTIDEYAFSYCRGLTSINIPNSVTTIGKSAFYYCNGLESVTISNSVTTINESAFSDCTKLINVIIPNSVTTISTWAFSNCTRLTAIDLPNSVIYIGRQAFRGSGLISMTIPNSVTTIDYGALSYCTKLTSVTIPNSVTTISEMAFGGCTELTDVYSYITDLSKVSIETYAFYQNSYSNRTLHVPYGTLAAYQADSNWSQYFGSIMEMDSTFEVDGIFYKANVNEAEVTSNPSANKYYGNVSIPAAVTYCGKTYQVTAIGAQVFADCTRLTSITIPNTVTAIGKQAFMNDAAIEVVTCEATPPPVCDGLDIFPTNVYNHTPLYVPMGCARTYMLDLCWGQFATIIGAGDTNMDGNISIADVTTLINQLLNNSDSPASDANGDGLVNIKDVTFLINMLLSTN